MALRRVGGPGVGTAQSPLAGLGRALGLTVASAMVWGIAHISAGRRTTGFTLMGLFGGLVLGSAAVSLFFVEEVKQVVVQRSWLYGITVGILLLATTWTAVVFRSFQVSEPTGLPPAMRATSGALVVIMALGICVPLVYAARATYVLRDTVSSIFPSDSSGAKVNAVDPWRGKPRVNILLLGGDAGKDRTGIRTDSMTVASIDTKTGDAVLLGLPRSLQRFPMPPRLRARWPAGFTGFPGEEGLLNEVFLDAENHPELVPGARRGQRGPRLLSETISYLIGMKIDYYILVNLSGFRDIVDAVGGVKVRITKRLPIGGDDAPGRYRPPTGYLEPGYRRLNGEQALWFGRSRHADDDFHRMDRQKCLMKDIAEQADPQKVLTGFEKLAAAAKKTIATNIPAELLPALVELSNKVKSGAKMHSLAYNPDKVPGFRVYQPRITTMRLAATKAIADSQKPPSPTPTATKKKRNARGAAGGAESLDKLCAT